jgi:fatty aldehyde-generating acyl-ACP reductase
MIQTLDLNDQQRGNRRNLANDTFAFMIHPIDIRRDVNRKFPPLGTILPEALIHRFSRYFPPLMISEVTGLRSAATGRPASGWFVACPFTPYTMLHMPVARVYDKIVAVGELAERRGARLLGLGAFTSVVGDAGVTIAERLAIPVTTGDSYTVAVVLRTAERALASMGLGLAGSRAAVVGATGAIGLATARLLAGQVDELLLVGRRPDALAQARERCEGARARVRATTDLAAIACADLIVSATSALGTLIEPQHLRPGAVVVDIAQPPDVARTVQQVRQDVLVVEGSLVAVPGPAPDFHFDFGYPPAMVYPCMAETMALAMEGRYEDYTLGRELDPDRIREIDAIAERHGFALAGLISAGRPLPDARIAHILSSAQQTRLRWSPAGC